MVGIGVDARQAAPHHLSLQPQPIVAIALRQRWAIAIPRCLAAAQRHRTPRRQLGERGPCRVLQPPWNVFRQAERPAWRIDARETGTPPIVEHQRVAIGDRGDAAVLCYRRTLALSEWPAQETGDDQDELSAGARHRMRPTPTASRSP